MTIDPTPLGAGDPERLGTDSDHAAGETLLVGDGIHPAPTLDDKAVSAFLDHLDDASPVIATDPEEVESLRARYLLGEELGSGAIGQVMEAWDQHLGRRVAIKVLHGEGVSRERLARFIPRPRSRPRWNTRPSCPSMRSGTCPTACPISP